MMAYEGSTQVPLDTSPSAGGVPISTKKVPWCNITAPVDFHCSTCYAMTVFYAVGVESQGVRPSENWH